jgi:hypothetical protein
MPFPIVEGISIDCIVLRMNKSNLSFGLDMELPSGPTGGSGSDNGCLTVAVRPLYFVSEADHSSRVIIPQSKTVVFNRSASNYF